MKMNKAVQIRMPIEMWDHLSTLATKRAPGTKVTHLIREAIQRTFYSEGEGGSGITMPPAPPVDPYRLQEITALRAAEEPKKSRTQ
jgi:hypothetical protein